MASLENKEITLSAFRTKLESLYLENNEDNEIIKNKIDQLIVEIPKLNSKKDPRFLYTFYKVIKNKNINDMFNNGSVDQSALAEISKEVKRKIETESKTNHNFDAEGPKLQVVEQNEITQEDVKDKLEKMDFSNLSIDDIAYIGRNYRESKKHMSDEDRHSFIKKSLFCADKKTIDESIELSDFNAEIEKGKELSAKSIKRAIEILSKRGIDINEDNYRECLTEFDLSSGSYAAALGDVKLYLSEIFESRKKNNNYEITEQDLVTIRQKMYTPEFEKILKLQGVQVESFLNSTFVECIHEIESNEKREQGKKIDLMPESLKKYQKEHQTEIEDTNRLSEKIKNNLNNSNRKSDINIDEYANISSSGPIGVVSTKTEAFTPTQVIKDEEEDVEFDDVYGESVEEIQSINTVNNIHDTGYYDNEGEFGSETDENTYEEDVDIEFEPSDIYGYEDYSDQVENIETINDSQIVEGEKIQENIEDISDFKDNIDIEQIIKEMMEKVPDFYQVLKSNIEAVGDISQDDTIISEPNTEDANDFSQNENDNSFLARVKETISSIFTAIMNKDRFGVGDGGVIPKDKGIRNSLINVGEDVMKYIKAVVEKIKNSFKNIDKIAKLNRGEQVALPPANNSVKTTKTNDFLESLIVPGNTVKLPDKQVSVNSVNVKPYIEKPLKPVNGERPQQGEDR